jgi:hypothetical protein
MPRKKSGENLTKVISSIVSVEDFKTLEGYAKVYYNQNLLKLPTISHMVRYILSNWVKDMRRGEQSFIRRRDLNQPAPNKLSTAGNAKIDPALWDRYLKPGKT